MREVVLLLTAGRMYALAFESLVVKQQLCTVVFKKNPGDIACDLSLIVAALFGITKIDYSHEKDALRTIPLTHFCCSTILYQQH